MIEPSEQSAALAQCLNALIAKHIYPNKRRYYLEAEKAGPLPFSSCCARALCPVNHWFA